jgi:hypothetical protein
VLSNSGNLRKYSGRQRAEVWCLVGRGIFIFTAISETYPSNILWKVCLGIYATAEVTEMVAGVYVPCLPSLRKSLASPSHLHIVKAQWFSTRTTYALPLFYWWPLGVILSGIFVFTWKGVYVYMQLCSSDITFVVWRYMFVIKILSLGQSFSLDLYNFTPTNVLYFSNVERRLIQ